MPDEGKLRLEVNRALQAQQLLDNPLWLEAWAAIDERCRSEWENSAEDQTEAREEIWKTWHVAKKLKRSFEVVMKTGELAERQLQEIRK